MNKSPCFPFYPSDFFGDIKVRIMTGEEQAFYLLLLANIWEYDTQFSIPDDPKIISMLLKISEEKFLEISEKILACLERKNGRLISKRLKKEKEKQDNYRKKQSEKGLKSAAKRATTVQPEFNHGSTGAPTAGATEGQPEVNSSKPKPKPKPKPNNYIFRLPEWIDSETWAEFESMRNRIKKPLTPWAAHLIVTELENIKTAHNDNPIDVLNQSIRLSWQDVYPIKNNGNSNSTKGMVVI